MLVGGCYCGRVRYRVDSEPHGSILCHCIDCRRIAAAPATAWMTIPAAALSWTAEPPVSFPSSARVVRCFCPHCGTPLTYANGTVPGELDVTTCSLDDPEAVAPQEHTWTAHRLSWVHLADGLAEHSGDRQS